MSQRVIQNKSVIGGSAVSGGPVWSCSLMRLRLDSAVVVATLREDMSVLARRLVRCLQMTDDHPRQRTPQPVPRPPAARGRGRLAPLQCLDRIGRQARALIARPSIERENCPQDCPRRAAFLVRSHASRKRTSPEPTNEITGHSSYRVSCARRVSEWHSSGREASRFKTTTSTVSIRFGTGSSLRSES